MVGLIQIIGYLLCVYLVFKGVEIFQIAWMSAKPNNAFGVVLGGVMIAGAVVVAIAGAYMLTEQAAAIGNNMQNLQNLNR